MIPTTLAERARFHWKLVAMITTGAVVVAVVVVAILMAWITWARYQASSDRPDVKEVRLLNVGGLGGVAEGATCLVSLDAPLKAHLSAISETFAVYQYTQAGDWYGQCPSDALVSLDTFAIARRAQLRALSGR